MFFQTSYIFGMLIVSIGAQHSGESTEEVACASCLHLSYELRNMPALYRLIMDGVLSNLNLANPACVSDTVERETCAALTYPQWSANKCSDTTVTLDAVGITGVLPDAEMSLTVTVKDCIVQWIGESDGCTNFEDLDAATQQAMAQQLASLGDSWNSVTYSGRVCITPP